jgi:hypothetical protein
MLQGLYGIFALEFFTCKSFESHIVLTILYTQQMESVYVVRTKYIEYVLNVIYVSNVKYVPNVVNVLYATYMQYVHLVCKGHCIHT